ncbi:P43 5S RNA-binding protein-like isoform X2 [Rhinatrema bivittatum]|uniref:P43 5S RNA-binding protein-like isoform X2 n=1 Tax=Rhinatrema bivittatum TaxID=194408 RepID=UPI00112628DC|nr:P43 5S RNA-binding protein-like isoform X2 [Rhinatrema bivittatum]
MEVVAKASLEEVPVRKSFSCTLRGCGASFSRAWKLQEHLRAHTGQKPLACDHVGCSRCFSHQSHLQRHTLQHSGEKPHRCSFTSCESAFVTKVRLERHVRYLHGEQPEPLKCTAPGCDQTFRKKAALKNHLTEHERAPLFLCQEPGCDLKFESRSQRKAHQRKHMGYLCSVEECKMRSGTWSDHVKHLQTHRVQVQCTHCEKTFQNRGGLRRHKRTHATKKPVLLCPWDECDAQHSTVFNLQHHIRKQHLHLLTHPCYFPGCTKAFAMRESLIQHLVVHDPDKKKLKLRRPSLSMKWQKRLRGDSGQEVMVEQNLSRLFAQKLIFRTKPRVESDLSGLFNERKLRPYVEPEVNLQPLFELPPGRRSEKAV